MNILSTITTNRTLRLPLAGSLVSVLALTPLFTSCVDEVTPANYVTPDQVSQLTSSQETMLNGIVESITEHNTWGQTYYTNDWGYPSQMMLRDVLTADFPCTNSGYNYWVYPESGQDVSAAPYYTYNYYYAFLKNVNGLVGVIDPATASDQSKGYLGGALTFRAMAYLDLARMFEYKKTGFASLDARADSVWGLTVPIVTENTTDAESRNNPRAPFYTMYRFILTDLNDAVEYLSGYTPAYSYFPDQTAAYGMLARLWLEMGTRFDLDPADLTTQLSHENDADGYDKLGITTANECFAKAAEYAQLAETGHTPMTESEWRSPNTGFNTAVSSWMLYGNIGTKEQEGQYYCSLIGTVCTEAAWGMCQYGDEPVRMIGSALYKRIGAADWRKLSWISPDDAGKTPNSSNNLATKYNLATWTSSKTNSNDKFADYPAYANLKYRTRDNTNYLDGMLCDIPLMRVEEMYFIDAEATARTEGVAAGVAKLQDFLNNYRYSGGTYTCKATTLDAFLDELIAQKRIEFWGEGLSYFDYKRLKMQVNRTANTNYPESFLHDSKVGYVCPSMNYYILDYEQNQNPAVIQNPDCSGWYDLQ